MDAHDLERGPVTQLARIARAWWRGDGTTPAFDAIDDIVSRDHALVPQLIAALMSTAPPDALPYIGTSVVEDLSFEVEDGRLTGEEALRLIVDSGGSPSELFSVFTGAYAHALDRLDALRGAPFSPVQTSWLLDDDAPNRWAQSGQTILDGDGLAFIPQQTRWQAELANRFPDSSSPGTSGPSAAP
jgi:hypothetical protein